ncbi:hypothetical protein [Metasolibacillus meyeri]|uniref:hypothetical protein n=1 Tax=Metasolibacillus meyeri TaxID=1071052 RepID=UPI000D32378B|nr:hypothetical protein [Metasolibacillus meyeri]
MNTKWDEENIEKLLTQAPKIQDHRSKEEIFAKLQAAGAFEEEPVQQPSVTQRKRRSYKWVSSIAVAAVVTCGVGISMFINMEDEHDKASNIAMQNENEQGSDNEAAETEAMGGASTFAADDVMTARTAIPNDSSPVYEDNVGEGEVFTFSLAGEEDVSIPSAIVIPREKLVEDLGKEKPSQAEMYNFYAPKLDEKGFGFEEQHPIAGEVTEDGQELVIALENPENQPMDKTIKETFPQYDEILLEKGASASDQIGLATMSLGQNYSYYLFTQQDKKYFVQQPEAAYNHVDEAILGMTGHATEKYESAIVEGITFTVTTADYVHVKFDQPLDLETIDYVQAKHMLEGMMLTAATFKQQIIFENIVQTVWDRFDFTQPQPIPVAPNELPLDIIQP